jgi:CheY-like chemotaxis protein
MPEDVRRRAFEPFFTTKEPGRGTGLGLATTYAIIKEHGGTIDIESIPSVGTRVHINLPAIELASERASVDAPQNAKQHGGGERILIVDDEALVRDSVARILADAGYRVETVAHGEAGLEMVRRQRDFALVLLDQSMPGLSARETLRELRRLQPEIGIICFSGYPAALEDCDESLEKPVPEEELLSVARRVIHKRRS